MKQSGIAVLLGIIVLLFVVLSCIQVKDFGTLPYDPSNTSLTYSIPWKETFHQETSTYTGGGGSGGDGGAPDLSVSNLWVYERDTGSNEIDIYEEYQQLAGFSVTVSNLGDVPIEPMGSVSVRFYLSESDTYGELDIGQEEYFMGYGSVPVAGLEPGESSEYEGYFFMDKYGFPNGEFYAHGVFDLGNMAIPEDENTNNNVATTATKVIISNSGDKEDEVYILAISTRAKNTDTFIMLFDFDIAPPQYRGIESYPTIDRAVINTDDLSEYLGYPRFYALASYLAVYFNDDLGVEDANSHWRRFLPRGNGVEGDDDDRTYYIRMQLSPNGLSQDIGSYSAVVHTRDHFPPLPEDGHDPANLAPLYSTNADIPHGSNAKELVIDGDAFHTNFSGISDYDWYKIVRP